MAAGVLAKPGQKYGPCVAGCQHKDCASQREIASEICRYCQKPIGYDTRFYDHGGDHVHAECLEDNLG